MGFMAGLTIPPYELPDGTKINNNEMICTAAERWFVPVKKMASSSSGGSGGSGGSGSTGSSSSGSGGSGGGSNDKFLLSPSSDRGTEIDCETETLQGLVHHCLSKCDTDVKKDLLANIVIVGGGSLIDGVSNRLSFELNDMLPSNMKVIVHQIIS